MRGLKIIDNMPIGIPKSGINKGWFKKGQIMSQEIRKKISKSSKGKKKPPLSKEHKRKLSESHKGRQFPNISNALKGRIISYEWRKKMSETHKKIGSKPPLHIGKDCHFWKGGISFAPYSLDWTRTLRRSVRERDKYTCQICGKLQSDRAFDVHHIDYDKKNCNPNNLITLCHSCHTKTNTNRNYWKERIKENK